ncbi:glycosyltransferase family 39 protein [Paenibacillus zeisoli]|uniref:Glycosyltransferase family 39 protein n=1 Tax=Paenibacillus zeisoli TaxID=2496267 RepID=A0A433XNL4_9BACL|nr:glycosyltransferase family 39 protein [Paenibacillus zeisoli]RUT35665.1 glycosyltransferase family 39 protein [Paenibacillus zeisoli]
MEKKRDSFVFWVCCGVFAVSILTIFIHQNSLLLGSLGKLDNDDVRYLRSGQYLLEHGKLIYYNPVTTLSAFIMPGLPVLIAGIMKVFGTGDAGIYAFRIFQALLTTASIGLIYLIANRLFGLRTAKIAVVLAAAYVPIYYAGDLILTETCFTFFLLLLSYVFLIALSKNRKRDYVLLGLVIAAAIYFRPTAAMLPLIIGMTWLFRREKLKLILRNTILLGLTLIICLSPWWIRNYQVFHQFIPLTNSSANPLLLGMLINGEEPQDFIRDHEQIYQTYRHGSEEQQKELAMMIFKYQITHHPFIFGAWLIFGKLIRLIIVPFYWAPILGIPYWLAALQHVIYLIFSIAGIWKMLRHRTSAYYGFLSILAYFVVIYLPFITMERYFYPTMLLMMIPLAHFMEQWRVLPINRRRARSTSLSEAKVNASA